MRGQTLELYFIEGRPDGMLTAQLFNWTGHVLQTPRTRLAEALRRPESSQTGVYILLGEDENGRQKAYIGETEDLRERLRNHEARKDWWTSAVLITAIGNLLNKAHVKHLESWLVETARSVNLIDLDNGNTPPRSSLGEAARNNMEVFLDNLLHVLPAIGVRFFIERRRDDRPATSAPNESNEIFHFTLATPKHGIRATARLENGEFIVEAGSLGRVTWEGVPEHNYSRLFQDIANAGITQISNGHRLFLKDFAFGSPSAAGAVLNGRATNGPDQWRVADNPTIKYKEWEERRLAVNE